MSDAVLLPVYNEESTVAAVLDAVRRVFDGRLIVVDDGSTDTTSRILAARADVSVLTHPINRGYGQALIDGFAHARETGVERLVTMDCDGQHEPGHITRFLGELQRGDDIVSGSRYLPESGAVGATPEQRRRVNGLVTAEINRVTGWKLTDAFCGFKAYRVEALAGLDLREPGYAMPLELWALAHRRGLRVREMPVERIYADGDRSFGLDLDQPDKRLAYYLRVWREALQREVTR